MTPRKLVLLKRKVYLALAKQFRTSVLDYEFLGSPDRDPFALARRLLGMRHEPKPYLAERIGPWSLEIAMLMDRHQTPTLEFADATAGQLLVAIISASNFEVDVYGPHILFQQLVHAVREHGVELVAAELDKWLRTRGHYLR